MNKFVTTFLAFGALTVSACATDGTNDISSREVAAPYADERTIGHEERVVLKEKEPRRAERTFRDMQRK